MATGNGYTPTHYVAPFGGVSGATSDIQDQGATAWTNAANSGTPCTLGTALARATAGNIVQLAPGQYDRDPTGLGATTGCFTPSNAGTSGNLITFAAQYPAVLNEAEPELFSQLRRVPERTLSSNCPVWGGRSYTKIDGLYFDYDDGALPWARGVVYFGNVITGMEAHRLLFDRSNQGDDDDGDNYNCIHHHTTTDAVMRNCHFRNGFDATGSHNESCITTYDATNFLIEHNWFENVTTAIYVKGSGSGEPNSGIIRYNLIEDCLLAVQLTCTLATGSNEVHFTQNIVSTVPAGQHTLAFENSAPTECRNFKVYNNTFIGGGDEVQGVVYVEGTIDGEGCEFYNNIVATMVDSTSRAVWSDFDLSAFARWDYNRYYENGNTIQYHHPGGTVSGLAAWQSGSGRDAHSSEGTPGFVNAATGDYHLAGGSACLTAGDTGGPIGAYITGDEVIGLSEAGEAPAPDPDVRGAMPFVAVVL